MKEFKRHCQTIDHFIQQGKFNEAKSALRLWKGEGSWSRWSHADDLSFLANLLRRVGSPMEALQLLKNKVYTPEHKLREDAQPSEIIEYAASLIRIGIRSESRVLLKSLNSNDYPLVLLFQAFAGFTEWRYTEQTEFLLKFIQNPKTPEYEKRIGSVNLCSCFVAAGDDKKAIEHIKNQQNECKNFFPLLYANLLEIEAQNHLRNKRPKEALNVLDVAAARLPDSDAVDRLFIDKWRWIAKGQLGIFNKVAFLNEAYRLEKWSIRVRHHETRREIDRYKGLILKNVPFLRKAYFGTRFSAYKETLLERAAEQGIDIGKIKETPFVLKEGSGGRSFEFFLSKGEVLNGEHRVQLKYQQYLHRFVSFLRSESYAPLRLPDVWENLYPGQVLDLSSGSSLRRLDQIGHRFRRWCKEEKLPIILCVEDGVYSIHVQKNHATVSWIDDVVEPVGVSSSAFTFLDCAKSKLLFGKSFTRKDCVLKLGWSPRFASEWLAQAVRAGWIQKTGDRRLASYRWK